MKRSPYGQVGPRNQAYRIILALDVITLFNGILIIDSFFFQIQSNDEQMFNEYNKTRPNANMGWQNYQRDCNGQKSQNLHFSPKIQVISHEGLIHRPKLIALYTRVCQSHECERVIHQNCKHNKDHFQTFSLFIYKQLVILQIFSNIFRLFSCRDLAW